MGKDITATEVALVGAAASGLTVELERTAAVDEGGGTDGGPDGAGLVVAGSGAGLNRWDQRGMVSAEWAVGIIAAISIAGVLLAVITSGSVQDALLKFLLWVIEAFAGVVS